MTPADFAAEYLSRERAANRTPQGADPSAILHQMAEEYGYTRADARQAVLDHAIAGPC